MHLYNIAFKNIKKNFNNYLLYFLSLSFNIMIYYIFSALITNPQFISLSKTSGRMTAVFGMANILLIVFSFVFVKYSNTFFTKKRNKEVGLYSMMGIKKRTIARMMFYENIIMGLISTAFGIFLGVLLSKLFAMVLIKLMGYIVSVKFFFSFTAFKSTFLVFALIIGITSLHGYTLIYRTKLIDLFNADKKGEPEPEISKVFASLGVILTLAGYSGFYLAFEMNFGLNTLLAFLFVITGTFFLFGSFTPLMLKLLKNSKNKYYNGTNIITISQLLYRIKSNSATLAVISLLIASAICAISIACSFYYIIKTHNNEPYSFAYTYRDETLNKNITDTIKKYPEVEIKAVYRVQEPVLSVKFAEFDISKIKNYMLQDNSKFDIISESIANMLYSSAGMAKNIKVKNNEAFIINPAREIVLDNFTYLNKTVILDINGKKQKLKITGQTADSHVSSWFSGLTLVVKDNLYNEAFAYAKNKKDFMVIKKTKETDKINEKIISDIQKYLTKNDRFYGIYTQFRTALEGVSIILFSGLFLGLVFIAATGSIIYFKQLTEAEEDKKRYEILYKTGLSRKEIKKSIIMQILFVFMLPLIIGILHSMAAMLFFQHMLGLNIIFPVLLSISAFIAIYLFYFYLTYKSYIKIINFS